ncbi:hypothetical protein ABAC460_17555 [Asticcacaulis sp. AC460]|nr:hypothetical protein ABAC460_17555 [Asticcacaulis sp. AC460]
MQTPLTDTSSARPQNRQIKDMLYGQVAMIGKAAASPKRLELIELLCQAPMTVEALAREAQISVKLASAHLKDLKSARLVDTERQGKYVIYRLASEDVARFWVTTRMLAEARLTELKDALERFAGASDEWEGASRNDLLERAAAGDIIVIDVRPELEFQVAHLPFARSLPLAEIEERLNELPRDRPIVAYCRGPFCLMAKDAVNMLRARGFDAVKLRDGVAEWAAP